MPARKRKPKAEIGRPSVLKIEPRVGKAIVDAVTAGVPVNVAARAVGIEPGTVRSWITRGATARRGTVFAEFAAAIADARAKAAQSNVVELRGAARGGALLGRTTETVEKLGPDGEVVERKTTTTERRAGPDWRANAWWLERQLPQEFARVERHEVTGADGGPVTLAIGDLYRKDPEARAAGLLIAQRAIDSGAFDVEGEEA